MPQALSPGVTVVEKDFTQIVPAVSTSIGAFCGVFPWGPVSQPTRVSSESDLVSRFGRPVNIDKQYQSFFTAANFLAYTNNLLVTRVDTLNARNAASTQTIQAGSFVSVQIATPGSGYSSAPLVNFSGGTSTTAAEASSRLKVVSVTIVDGGSDYSVNDIVRIGIGSGPGNTEAQFKVTGVTDGAVTAIEINTGGDGLYSAVVADLTGVDTVNISNGNNAATGLTLTVVLGVASIVFTNYGDYSVAPTVALSGGSYTTAATIGTVTINRKISGLKIKSADDYITNFSSGSSDYGYFAAKYPGTKGNGLQVIVIDYTTWGSITSNSDLYQYRGQRPGTSDFAARFGITNDEVNVIVLDTPRGTFTGTANGIIDRFQYLSVLSDAQLSDGTDNYYKNAINNSGLIWWLSHPATTGSGKADWGSTSVDAAGKEMKALSSVVSSQLTGGVDDLTATDGDIQNAYALLVNAEEYDISLVMTGNVSPTTAAYVVQDVCEVRRDCIAFISPNDSGNPIIATGSTATDKIIDYKENESTGMKVSSSYAVMDSGFKYQYDRYNDAYHWIPLNGDIAGLAARTDDTNDAWWSPGGFNRGQIKNVVKLGFNPNKSDRDTLYSHGINPVTAFSGEGVVLFGDKTMLAKPSAFDRINVRRLFIVLEKAIARAAKYQLFEFNDEFTRAQFRSMVEPYLRDVKGRRGITDFRVSCDQRNNTPEVIDRNEFVADIYIKPARSVSFITLNFVATRTGVSFEEIGG